MSSSDLSINFAFNTDALFRSFFKPISDSLQAGGWSKVWTNINWATVIKPATTYTDAGSEVWAMTDSLQATDPKFLRINYGTGSAATSGRLTLTIGNIHDGAGNLSGNTNTEWIMSASTGSSFPCSFSAGPARFCCNYARSYNGNYNFGFGIERLHNNLGDDTEGGLLLLHFYSGEVYSRVVPTTGPIPAYQLHWNASIPPAGNGAINADVYLYPVRAWGYGESCASLNFFIYFNTDLTAGISMPATLWDGKNHTIMPTGNGFAGQYYGGAGVLSMRFE